MDFCFFDPRPQWLPVEPAWLQIDTDAAVEADRVYFARCEENNLVRVGCMKFDAEVPPGHNLFFDLVTPHALSVALHFKNRFSKKNVFGSWYRLEQCKINFPLAYRLAISICLEENENNHSDLFDNVVLRGIAGCFRCSVSATTT